MDDTHLGRMYAKLLVRNLAKRRDRAWRWMEVHQSSLLLAGVVIGLLIFTAGYVAHIHGRFSRLKTELKAIGETPVELPPMPGGQEAVVMQRSMLTEGSTPEFLSATLLPGRGLNVFQLMISVPGRGSIPLLASPSLEEATKRMTGVGRDQAGAESLAMGAAIEAPFAGSILGARSGDGQQVTAEWQGQIVSLPLTEGQSALGASTGGLLLKMPAETVKQNVMPDGGTLQGKFAASNFGGHWPSQVSVTMTALMSSRAFELKLVARNEGQEATPVGLGWEPQFLMPSGGRTGVKLRLPTQAHEEVSGGRSTGRLTDVSGTALDYTDRAGKDLKEVRLNDTFAGLHAGFLDNGPIAELRDTRSGTGLRMTAMTSTIRAIHVRTRPGDSRISLGFQTNYDDPFCRAWGKEGQDGMQVLQPGESLQWRIRLELFPLAPAGEPSL